nr:hypothetical protein [Tanacetum cinerariifolium]
MEKLWKNMNWRTKTKLNVGKKHSWMQVALLDGKSITLPMGRFPAFAFFTGIISLVFLLALSPMRINSPTSWAHLGSILSRIKMKEKRRT